MNDFKELNIREGIVKGLAQDNIKITIQDEGIGIPSDKLEYIFDRFKQVDGSTTRKYGGTGLGLTICKELVSLLNGEINVFSKLDIGSTFEVIIPKNSELAIDLDFQEIQNKNLERTSASFPPWWNPFLRAVLTMST